MTQRVELGRVAIGTQLVRVQELPPDAEQLAQGNNFTVLLGIGETDIEVDLGRVRALKRLLGDAERQLLLRHDQALKSRNMNLDL